MSLVNMIFPMKHKWLVPVHFIDSCEVYKILSGKDESAAISIFNKDGIFIYFAQAGNLSGFIFKDFSFKQKIYFLWEEIKFRIKYKIEKTIFHLNNIVVD